MPLWVVIVPLPSFSEPFHTADAVRSIEPPLEVEAGSLTARNHEHARCSGKLLASGNQDNFAIGARLHDDFVRARRFGKRNLMANHRAKRFIFKARAERRVDADE